MLWEIMETSCLLINFPSEIRLISSLPSHLIPQSIQNEIFQMLRKNKNKNSLGESVALFLYTYCTFYVLLVGKHG
jgi:hypothetical protein